MEKEDKIIYDDILKNPDLLAIMNKWLIELSIKAHCQPKAGVKYGQKGFFFRHQ